MIVLIYSPYSHNHNKIYIILKKLNFLIAAIKVFMYINAIFGNYTGSSHAQKLFLFQKTSIFNC